MAANTFQDIRHFLQRWDKGSNTTREQILQDFIIQCDQMTSPDLEAHFYDCASLVLARFTSWLRITYMFGTCLKLQLQAIGIFVSASTGFLMEFLEVGGVLTLLEIVSLKSCDEGHKAEALRLLTLIARKGRQYKEIICESYGIKVVGECLGLAQRTETQECAQYLLHQLSIGNPRYQSQAYKALITLLTAASSEAQRLAAYTLRQIQPSIDMVGASIVDPLLQLLKSLHSDVQQEAGLLINDVLVYEEIQQPLLIGLITLLKPEDLNSSKSNNEKSKISINLQQANAARILREVVKSHPALLSEKMIELNIIPHLLFAMGNTSYTESQRQACATLQVLMNDFMTVHELVQLLVGDSLFHKLKSTPASIPDLLTLDDIDILLGSGKYNKE